MPIIHTHPHTDEKKFHKIGNIYALFLAPLLDKIRLRIHLDHFFLFKHVSLSLFWAHLTGYFLKQPFQIALIGPNLSLLCGKDSPTLIHKLNLTWNWVSAIFSMKSPFSNLKFEARGNANVGSNPTQMQEKKKRKKGSNYCSKIKRKFTKCQSEIVNLI